MRSSHLERAKRLVKRIPLVGRVAGRIYRRIRPPSAFTDSETYWSSRYAAGENSGAGSYGKLAVFKAEVLNRFVAEHGVETVMELGCGDGAQLKLARYPRYVGYDVSEAALNICRTAFEGDPTKTFKPMRAIDDTAHELCLSLDVIYHLVEDDVFHSHMARLFDSSKRFVVIYASNTEEQSADPKPHVKHRKFTDWVERHKPEWRLTDTVENRYPLTDNTPDGSFCDFFFYEKVEPKRQTV